MGDVAAFIAEPIQGDGGIIIPAPGYFAAIQRFSDDEEAFTEANRLPYGLAAYAYTRSAETATLLLAHLASYPVCSSLWLEVLDTNDGKELSNFCRKFEAPLRKALIKAGRLDEQGKGPRLLLTFKSGREVFAGIAEANNSALWPMGIPRLKFPRQAPSRSTLKLEEAWHHFIPREQWDTRLAAGMTGVDLGAAPGGWTWQLVNRHIKVSAVDNGPMNADLMDSGLVEHFRADGFTFRPKRPVDWMVCDIVEKPARTGAMIETWIGEGLCREAIVNLKLPMKQRYAEVRRILDRLEESFRERGLKVQIGCKQLYHDREEVTLFARAISWRIRTEKFLVTSLMSSPTEAPSTSAPPA